MNNNAPLLSVAHVSKSFGSRKKGDPKKKVLEDISFSMHHRKDKRDFSDSRCQGGGDSG
uniref:Uncharacterized protein n=1 Tax=Acidithiobacillus ferrianus TaxID=2678518 RepID=A0A845U702_9PROT|nr:hypothetical protein [Acidithiobacillus ferrianus]NDU42653.1 hypothetical protein [Acidithiobacillus ferrianus]